ncbi:MAG: glycosyltransferase family 4 protein [Candidatus Pacebacteria bacterium]|nr:glycosyltransferase family 4 protein [Candidatus Paceibacterota bacterium]
MQEILIVGFPYVRERYFATFRHWPISGQVSFLLPRIWSTKNGKVVFSPPVDPNIATTRAYFHHSHYPIIGGLLKGFMPGFAVHLWRHRRDVRLVYSCSEPILLTTLFQAMWSKILGKKHIVFTWENIPYTEKFRGLSLWVHLCILRINLALSDGLICGNSEGALVHSEYTKKPIEIIPMNGLDCDVFVKDSATLRPSHLMGATVYTFIGAIGYRKGIQNIIKAFPDVIARVPNAHLIIAGSGEYEQQVDALIGELNLQDRIARFPWVEQKELIRILSLSDVFLYPSIPHGGWSEQFGYSMAEASLMELPVIATHTGSIADIVIDGETGILVPPDNVNDLGEAMIRLGTDSALREHLGAAGRRYISERFSHQAIAQRFSEFLNQYL